MFPLADRIQKANELLAAYAVPHQGLLGREHEEPEDETRSPFQRDRDRIIHTQAFRRLKGKTQVFVAGTHDHVRTRLTHTMEVAQISRDIARTLGLNEDLAECIALAHDLGHPPFGHAGEEELDHWMRAHRARFEHNEQSLRIVTLLEEHSVLFPGLNLNREVLEGLRKHTTPHDHPAGDAMKEGRTLEAALVDLADEIAYTAHDCDDGLRSKLFSRKELLSIPLAHEAAKRAEKRGTQLRGTIIHLLVTDLYSETAAQIADHRITQLRDVLGSPDALVCFSPRMQVSLGELRAFLWQHLYLHPKVEACNAEGRKVVSALCHAYEEDPPPKVTALQQKTHGALHEAICDYISGMTDAYATRQAVSSKQTS
ncbi:MAG: dNTP triphosphohydrolase [Candidatus Peribacteraceae bacterium]|nr:dNTP triphosphohydrolase [Candidatus Peribacteraceae bacterium]